MESITHKWGFQTSCGCVLLLGLSEGRFWHLEHCFVGHKLETLHLEGGKRFPTKVALGAHELMLQTATDFKIKRLTRAFLTYSVSNAEAQYPAVFKNTSVISDNTKKELTDENLLKTKRQLFIVCRKILVLHVFYTLSLPFLFQGPL